MTVRRYSPNSLLSSPGWVLVKCELRTLAQVSSPPLHPPPQFSFQLSPDWELPDARGESEVEEGVRDMLVKHHLFSWNS